MDLIPNEILLKIIGLLDHSGFLTSRLVCKRFQDISFTKTFDRYLNYIICSFEYQLNYKTIKHKNIFTLSDTLKVLRNKVTGVLYIPPYKFKLYSEDGYELNLTKLILELFDQNEEVKLTLKDTTTVILPAFDFNFIHYDPILNKIEMTTNHIEELKPYENKLHLKIRSIRYHTKIGM